MVNFEDVELKISQLLAGVRSDQILVRACPDPEYVEENGEVRVILMPTDPSWPAVVTFGEYAIRPAAAASADFKVQALEYQVYFDIWCRTLRGETGRNQITRAVHQALQGKTLEGLGVMRFLDSAFERNSTKAIMLYSFVAMSQV